MEITGKRILEELAAIGFARINDYITLEKGVLIYKDWDRLEPGQKAAVAAAEQGSGGLKLKFYDKMKALELMGKILGLFEDGAAVSQEDSLVQALLQATGGEVDTGDIPELQQAADDRADLVEPAGTGGV